MEIAVSRINSSKRRLAMGSRRLSMTIPVSTKVAADIRRCNAARIARAHASASGSSASMAIRAELSITNWQALLVVQQGIVVERAEFGSKPRGTIPADCQDFLD